MSKLPEGHNWHPSYPDGSLCLSKSVYRNNKCLDCDIEISYLNVTNQWVLGYFASTQNIDVPIPSCEEGKMDKALK